MKFAFIHVEKAKYPVTILCGVLGVSRSGYYASIDRALPASTSGDARLMIEIAAAHKRSRGIYGSPRVHLDLKARGARVGEKRVARLMKENGIQGRQKRRFRRTTDSNHSHPIAPNVLARSFDASAPNRVWVTDVTYIATREGPLYLAVILDVFSRRIVGWAASACNDTELALDALRRAMRTRRPRAGLVHHSDRGSPYASADYRAELAASGMIASMSRTGDCYDNAVAESFFATLKAEHVDHERYDTRGDAVASIGDYIEAFYNRARRHSHVGNVSPIEFELRSQTAAAAA